MDASSPAARSPVPPIATVTANGLAIGYDVHGAGPPLILLHGASSSGREDFAAQIPLFSKAFRLYVPDARGHATTRWDPAAGFKSEDLVADVLAFADALHLVTFHLLGFSMGARTALRFATEHPDRLRTLVVIGYSVEREPRLTVARRVLDPDRIERDDPTWAAELERRHGPVQGPGAWRRLVEAVVNDVASQPDVDLAALRSVELPALVTSGDRDPFTPVGQAWSLQRQLPDARLLIVPGAGHQVASQRPGIFNEALATFYRSTEPAARRRSATRSSVAVHDGSEGGAGSGSVGRPRGDADRTLEDGTLAHRGTGRDDQESPVEGG
jgi:pimeloyl-ACP methyl ester carboxylesterase